MNALTCTAIPMEGPKDVGAAVRAAQAGDLAAFETVVRQYERLVLVTALRLLGNLDDAQDASQEVFLRLYRNLDKVAAVEYVSGWLYRVTVNVCHDLRRAFPAQVVADVDGHPVKPPRDILHGGDLVQVPVQPEEDLLRRVLRVVEIPEQPQRGHQHQAFVLPDHRLERRQVARLGRTDGGADILRSLHRNRRAGQRVHPSYQLQLRARPIR